MRHTILAICGQKRCGKDTLSRVLIDEFGFTQKKFAFYLKEMIKVGFGLTDEEVEGDKKDHIHSKYGVPPRVIMQFIGTEVMQFHIQQILPSIGRSFWAERLMTDLRDDSNGNGKLFVISDLRFLHEYDILKKESELNDWNLKIIKIYRGIHNSNGIDDTSNDHCSEKEWKDIPSDIELINDASLLDFINNSKTIMSKLLYSLNSTKKL